MLTRWGLACPLLLAPALSHFLSWGDTLSDAWGHAITATNDMFCSILPRVDEPDPNTHMSDAMEQRLGMYGLNPSDRVPVDEFWDGLSIGRRRRWSV